MPYLEKFKEAKAERKISNATISTLANIPLATVTRFFNGNTPNPTVETVVPIANVLGISLDEVFCLKEPNQKPLDPNVEAVISSYTELLKEKDERINEKEEIIIQSKKQIEELKIEKVKTQKEKGKVLSFALLFAIIVIFILLFDLMNGHFGYFRY